MFQYCCFLGAWDLVLGASGALATRFRHPIDAYFAGNPFSNL
jgi:hypothetical protein